jgi:hypothetical protein
MKVEVIDEHGHPYALFGMRLSFSEMDGEDIYTIAPKSLSIGKILAVKDGGENKFLEAVAVWLDIDAPLYWWQQMDTYRCGVSKQSESKMHTLTKRPLTPDDFESSFMLGKIDCRVLQLVNDYIAAGHFEDALRHLPMSFLQRRIVATNYKALRNICIQRRGHKLREWGVFVEAMETQLDWPWALKKGGAE